MSKRLAPTVKQTAFRFTEEDLAMFDLVQRHTGITEVSETTMKINFRSWRDTW